MRIGELAQQTGVKVETIRFYEQEGLIPEPERTASNYRSYTIEHLNRLSFIRRSRDLGFTLEQVRTLLQFADAPHQSCESVDDIALGHVGEIDRKIADLQALRDELVRHLDCCGRSTVAECRIIEALAPAAASAQP